MNTCKTCKYWHDDEFGNEWGLFKPCHHSKVHDNNRFHDHTQDELVDVLCASTDGDTPTILTGPDFGCIHHEPK